MAELQGWENFYVIVGSSAGALIGLQFVVMTLIAELPVGQNEAQTASVFTTPAVVHFGAVLALSAIVSAPWEGIAIIAAIWAIAGLAGIIYIFAIARRLGRQTAYKPVFEDRLFHVLLPFIAYAALVVSAVLAFSNARLAMFLIGAAALILLFCGIHNAWDIVTFHVFVRRGKQKEN